jgi:hypothetical protein
MKSTSHSNIKQNCRKRNSTVKLIPLSQRIGGTQNCLIQHKKSQLMAKKVDPHPRPTDSDPHFLF